jgi:hypothetical protein
VRIARWEEYPPLRILGWAKAAFLSVALLGFGVYYLATGNTAGKGVGAAFIAGCLLIAVGVAKRRSGKRL